MFVFCHVFKIYGFIKIWGKLYCFFLFFFVEEVERLKCVRDHFNVFSLFLKKIYYRKCVGSHIVVFQNISFADRLPRRLPLLRAHLD